MKLRTHFIIVYLNVKSCFYYKIFNKMLLLGFSWQQRAKGRVTRAERSGVRAQA
ncbi:MAG: hypothetical protein KG003_11785 [Bacteroidetes bacterium]|nr:hypothetical protein [Bacteroidota bacterium]